MARQKPAHRRASDFVPCTLKELPQEMLVSSAFDAIRENPANRPPLERLATLLVGFSPKVEHLALLTTKYWGSRGVRLSVSFTESTPNDLQTRILSHMNAWGQFSNVQFALTSGQGQVRISRGPGGYWSYLGTDVLSIPANQPTMNLQGFTMNTAESEFKRVVRHETGHTLGFPHEHMRREIVNLLDPQKTILYFMRTQGWSVTEVQQQVLTPIEERSILGTEHADQTSIMTYQLPGSITKDGKPIPGGIDIDASDRDFASKAYPLANPPVSPPTSPPPGGGSLGTVAVDLDNKRVYIPAGWSAQTR